MTKLMTASAVMALLSRLNVPVFNPGLPGWKVDDNGNLAKDAAGNPIYINSAGQEQPTDAGTIGRLNAEAKSHRERADDLAAKYKPFEGLDPEATKKAVEIVKKLDDKKLIDAGQIDVVRKEIGDAYTNQIAERDAKIAKLEGSVTSMTLDGAFKGSKFVTEKVAVPPDMLRATFAQHVKVEDGKPAVYDFNNQRIYSKTNPGLPADFDEALETLIGQYPHKDAILKPSNHKGTGGKNNGGDRTYSATMKRSDFATLPPAKQAEVAAKAGAGEIVLTD